MRANGLWWTAAVALAASGCLNTTPCTSNADCSSGGTCDTSAGFCVYSADGSAGGGATGGGGGMTGGGAGGGMTGGGSGGGGGGGGGGGPSDYCDAGLTCAPWQECSATAGGGECFDAGYTLRWVSPDAGAAFNMATVPGALAYLKGDGGAASVAAIPVTNATDFTPTGAVYTGTLSLGGLDGMKTFVAGWPDGGPTATLTVMRDTLAPTLNFARLGAAYFRDDIAVIGVTANEPLNEGSVSVTLGGRALARTDAGCPASETCWVADFSLPTLNGLDGGMQVTATARDLAGNNASATPQTVEVTRVRWVKQVTGGNMRVAPAVGPDGTLYVGTNDINFTAGLLQALEPQTGADAGYTDLFGAINAIAVSPPQTSVAATTATGTVVYVVANGVVGGGNPSPRSRLLGRAANLTDSVGTVTLPSPCEANGTNKTWSGLALTRTTANRVSAVATTASSASTPARLLKWDSQGGCTSTDLPQAGAGNTGSPLEPSVVPTQTPTAVSPIIVGTTPQAGFLTTQPNVDPQPSEGLFLRWVTNLTSGAPVLSGATPLRLDTSRLTTSAGAVRLSASDVLAASVGATQALHRVGSSASTPFMPAGALDYGLPALSSGARGFVGAGSQLYRFDPGNLSTAGVSLANFAGTTMHTSPVLLAARTGGTAEGYTVTRNGRLVRFDAGATGTSADTWSSPLLSGTVEVVGHPGFDCNRRAGAATATTGILYVPLLDGRVMSIIVDSARLLQGADAWPKYQRTTGNAGSDDAFFPTMPASCP